jgi:hypothetical protein
MPHTLPSKYTRGPIPTSRYRDHAPARKTLADVAAELDRRETALSDALVAEWQRKGLLSDAYCANAHKDFMEILRQRQATNALLGRD